MNTRDIATELVALCNAGENMAAMEKFYAPNITSLEVMEPMRELHGYAAVVGKAMWWNDNHVVHHATATGPWVNGDNFIVQFDFDVTQKATGKRVQVREFAYYTVEGDKIVKEQFFY